MMMMMMIFFPHYHSRYEDNVRSVNTPFVRTCCIKINYLLCGTGTLLALISHSFQPLFVTFLIQTGESCTVAAALCWQPCLCLSSASCSHWCCCVGAAMSSWYELNFQNNQTKKKLLTTLNSLLLKKCPNCIDLTPEEKKAKNESQNNNVC